jgi:hypothetical protein
VISKILFCAAFLCLLHAAACQVAADQPSSRPVQPTIRLLEADQATKIQAPTQPVGNRLQFDSSAPEVPVVVTASFTAASSRQPAELFITAKLKPGYCLYSITQPSGGPNRTIIEVEESPAFRLRGPFKAIQQPCYETTPWPEWPIVEKHLGCITWHATIDIAPGVAAERLTITGGVTCQVDTESFCFPPTSYRFTATLGQSDIRTVHRPSPHRLLSCLSEGRPVSGWLWRAWRYPPAR